MSDWREVEETVEALETLRRVVEETVGRKLIEVLPANLKFPLPVLDRFLIKGRKVKIILEVYEHTVVAYLVEIVTFLPKGQRCVRRSPT